MFDSKKRKKTKFLIEEAMISLLQIEPFDKITTVEIAKKAGISRSNFYTYYKDKYDMIEYYQTELFHKINYIFEKNKDNDKEALIKILYYLKEEKMLPLLVSENGTKEMQSFFYNKFELFIARKLNEDKYTKNLSSFEKEYTMLYKSKAILGIIQYWGKKNKKESPEIIANFIMSIL